MGEYKIIFKETQIMELLQGKKWGTFIVLRRFVLYRTKYIEIKNIETKKLQTVVEGYLWNFGLKKFTPKGIRCKIYYFFKSF